MGGVHRLDTEWKKIRVGKIPCRKKSYTVGIVRCTLKIMQVIDFQAVRQY